MFSETFSFQLTHKFDVKFNSSSVAPVLIHFHSMLISKQLYNEVIWFKKSILYSLFNEAVI